MLVGIDTFPVQVVLQTALFTLESQQFRLQVVGLRVVCSDVLELVADGLLLRLDLLQSGLIGHQRLKLGSHCHIGDLLRLDHLDLFESKAGADQRTRL